MARRMESWKSETQPWIKLKYDAVAKLDFFRKMANFSRDQIDGRDKFIFLRLLLI